MALKCQIPFGSSGLERKGQQKTEKKSRGQFSGSNLVPKTGKKVVGKPCLKTMCFQSRPDLILGLILRAFFRKKPMGRDDPGMQKLLFSLGKTTFSSFEEVGRGEGSEIEYTEHF